MRSSGTDASGTFPTQNPGTISTDKDRLPRASVTFGSIFAFNSCVSTAMPVIQVDWTPLILGRAETYAPHEHIFAFPDAKSPTPLSLSLTREVITPPGKLAFGRRLSPIPSVGYDFPPVATLVPPLELELAFSSLGDILKRPMNHYSLLKTHLLGQKAWISLGPTSTSLFASESLVHQVMGTFTTPIQPILLAVLGGCGTSSIPQNQFWSVWESPLPSSLREQPELPWILLERRSKHRIWWFHQNRQDCLQMRW